MRKATTIFFICFYLFSYTELHQFFTLPAFFEHYVDHRTANPGIGLIDFIRLHYAKAEHSHTNHDHHELPFKDDHCLQTLTLNPIYFSELFVAEFSNVAVEKSPHPFVTQQLFCSLQNSSIWQPPRI